MSRFEPATFLALVESHRVTISQMVPRMFVRLLKMPESERDRFDVSSLQTIVHSAAPCPPMIKRAMIDWWGPILYEFYSGSEGFGGTFISSAEWLERPGSVGKPAWGRPHICDEAGREQDFGATGIIYFEGASEVEVLNDPARSQQARHPDHPGWATFGDVGRMDADGYVYLIDRAAFVIRSGGHLIHPQDIEDELIAHPRVCDAAVFGVPDPASGERVKALVQPLDWAEAGPDLADALLDHCRTTLGPLNCPATIAFEAKLPRGVNGKLYKKVLIDREKQSS
jgi:acyl-coenzyme A synthetase/AMP-(fatty) acid ligase